MIRTQPLLRRCSRIALFPHLCLFLAALGVTLAADPTTGSIQGRVVNGENGNYLSKAVVSVVGTSLQTLTDDFGNYTLDKVPAGNPTLKVEYTGQEPVSAQVKVTAGQSSHEDFMFNRNKALATSGEGAVLRLDEYVVQTERYRNATEIAIHEERYSPTLKNVVAAGAFGDIPDGNVGEFVKYIPGVQIGYGYGSTGLNAADSNATSISVRGFGPEMTQITIDGVPLTNASPASLTRAVGLDMMTINNASRVEVIKVATPDMPSNSPGGAVNLITRSAFEYARPTFNFSVGANFNSELMHDVLKRTPGPANKKTYKTLPSFDFSYVIPIKKNMGVAISGGWSQTFNVNHRGISDYLLDTKDVSTSTSYAVDLRPGGGPNINVKGGGTSTTFQSIAGKELNLANPALYRFQAADTPNTVTRKSAGLRWDWKPNPLHQFSVGYTLGLFDSVDAQRRLQFYPDKSYLADWGSDYMTSYKFIPKGTVVNGTALAADFNPKATVNMTVTTRDRSAATHTGYFKYDFRYGPWQVKTNINASRSRGSYKDMPNGHFSELETSLTAGQVTFKGIHEGIPSEITVLDKSGNPVDWGDLKQWSAPSISAKSGQTEAMDQHINARIDIQRDLDFIHIGDLIASAKTGFYRDQQREKKWGLGTGYKMTYYGPTLALSDYMDDGYVGISPGFGLRNQQWISTYKLYDLWKQHPDYFNANSDSDMANNYTSWANQQKSITETSDQYYLMFDGKVFKNRLSWLFGTRQEISTRKGYATKTDSTWNYVKNPDGTIYRDNSNPGGVKIDSSSSVLFAQTAAGASLRSSLDGMKVTYPTAPIANGTYAMKLLQLKPFSNMDGKITGKPTYTASGAFNITEDFVARLSWNRAQGKPDFEDGILAAYSISENSDTTTVPRGTIKIGNPNLKPWIANSWDLQLAYYTKSGGKFAVTPYYKATENFQDSYTIRSDNPEFGALVESIGLDPSLYQDYEVTTTLNGQGTSKTLGYELEVQQDLASLGRIGKFFQVFGSFSHQYIKQNNVTPGKGLSAKPTANSTASGGIAFTSRRVRALLRGVWLQEKYTGEQTTYTYQGTSYVVAKYNPSIVTLDLNVSYQLSLHYSLFANGRNVLNNSTDTLRYDKTGILPDYARHVDRREFGIQWNVGVKGTY